MIRDLRQEDELLTILRLTEHPTTSLEKFWLNEELIFDRADFKRIDRKTYKTAARKCSEAGVPIRTGVEYRHGQAVKMLTIFQSYQ